MRWVQLGLLGLILSLVASDQATADYGVIDKGMWPKSWPKTLDPVRKQARTLVGPMIEFRHYLIPFEDRDTFEAAWPELLKVKSKGAPIFLVRAPKTDFFAIKPAGVYVHSPPEKGNWQQRPTSATNLREKWQWSTYFVLAVDGKIVDLNRIKLPPDTPIIDERFQPRKQGKR